MVNLGSLLMPENIHTSPTEGISPPLRKFILSFKHFYIFYGLKEPPTPRKFQSLLWGEYGYFLELHIVVRCDIQIILNTCKYIKVRQSPA